MNKSHKPSLYMMIGLSGSGKSYYAQIINMKFGAVIHSSDDLGLELYGDENCQNHNEELFTELHRKIKNDLRAGKDVCYDATNISKKRRISFLKELKNIDCNKFGFLVATPYKRCIRQNSSRERKVQEYVIENQYKSFCPPHINEGFDDICILQNIPEYHSKEYDILKMQLLHIQMYEFDQENSHHSLTLGKHCISAMRYIKDKDSENYQLAMAAYLHDIGKLHTKTRLNSKGEDDGNCHYYQHHCAGSYDSFQYNYEFSDKERLEIAQYIYYHMHPYMSWKQSEKSRENDRKLLGEKVFNNIMLLHEADVATH